MHSALNGSMAINDTIILDSKKTWSHRNQQFLWVVLLVLWSCLHTVEVSADRQRLHDYVCVHACSARCMCMCVCVSINQSMFIHSTMCVPDSIKWVNSVWRNVSVREDRRKKQKALHGCKLGHHKKQWKMGVNIWRKNKISHIGSK